MDDAQQIVVEESVWTPKSRLAVDGKGRLSKVTKFLDRFLARFCLLLWGRLARLELECFKGQKNGTKKKGNRVWTRSLCTDTSRLMIEESG